MAKTTHTPGPWGGGGGYNLPIVAKARGLDTEIGITRSCEGRLTDDEVVGNALLMRAAPAFEMAWALVPEDIKGKIFDALHGPDTQWVEESIRNLTEADHG